MTQANSKITLCIHIKIIVNNQMELSVKQFHEEIYINRVCYEYGKNVIINL